MIPYNEDFHKATTGPHLLADYLEAHRRLGDDDGCVVHPARVERDVCERGMSYEASEAKHRREWRQELGLPVPPEPALVARRGLVRLNNRLWVDDDGPFHPLGFTLFWALNGWKFERDRFRQNCEWFKPYKFDYARLLCQVAWDNTPIDPTWPDYEQTLAEVIDYLYDEIGVRSQLTLIGGGVNATVAMQTAEKVCRMAEPRASKIINQETANESFATFDDPDALVRISRYLVEHSPHRVAVSSPGDFNLIRAITQEAGAHFYTHHPARDYADHGWRMVRQGYDAKDFGKAVDANEPGGPLSSIHSYSNPLLLAMARAVSVCCGGGAWVLHCGSMVYGKPDPGHGRPGNVWEVTREMDGTPIDMPSIVRALRGIDAMLPNDVENWQVANTGWTPPNPVAPFQPDMHWPADEGQPPADHGINKAYSASDGTDFVQLPCGVLGYVILRASRACEAVAYDPLTSAIVSATRLSAGETWRLEGRDDTMTAYIVRGRYL